MKRYIDPSNKVLAHVDRLDAIKQGYKPAPINIEIDLSNRCSLGCEWCHFAYTHTRGPLALKVAQPDGKIAGGDLMDYELAKSIIIQAKQLGVRSLTWTGGGEPTLHPQFDRIIEFAARHGMEQGLYTHGGHITEARAALLKRAMKWVYISLDECSEAQYKESKGVNGFARAIQGLQRLADADGAAVVGVGFLLHKNNYGDIKKMINLGRARGADYIQFRPTVSYAQEAPAQFNDDRIWISLCIDQLLKWQDAPGVLVDIERFMMYRDWNGRGYSTCYWTQLQTVITPNGKMWACVNKREHAGAEIGDLSESSLGEIWREASRAHMVGEDCRIMCRGHMANITLDSVMNDPAHRNFI